MFSRAPIRSAVGVVLLLAALTTGLFVSPGIRHRHDDGDAAHSHSHPHDHGHSHAHGHSHPHSHSHAHHADHHHGDDGVDSEHGGSGQIEAEGSTHVHVSVFGFELTLPDFFDDRAAPIVGDDSGRRSNTSRETSEGPLEAEVLRLHAPLSLGHLVQIMVSWTAIVCGRFQPAAADILVGMLCVPADLNLGRHPPAPPLPPPKAR